MAALKALIRPVPVAIAIAAVAAVAAPLALRLVSDSYPVSIAEPAVSVEVRDRHGDLLRPFAVADGRWRLGIDLDKVDPLLIAMIIAYEDKRFHRHSGVDPWALSRAAGQLVMNGRIVSGGSTVTMQLARLLADGESRSFAGKINQILAARALETRLDKRQILSRYLTLAPYGGNLEGVRAASLAYFGKEPVRLTPAQAALLVALPQAPEHRRPDRHPAAARAARDRVLQRMAEAGVISADAARAGSKEPIPVRRRAFPLLAAHEARRTLAANPDRRIHRLTLNGSLQGRLERLVTERMTAADKYLSLAMVVADHRTGDIVARIGSAGLLVDDRRGHIDMTRAVRSPGSALKPLIYGLAFQEGLAHPASLVEDRPTAFGGYEPGNFDKTFQGTVTVRTALAQSLNVPAVLLLDAVGPARLVAALRRAGMRPDLPQVTPPGLAIGLGGIGVTLTDLVALYGALARGGKPVALRIDADSEPIAGSTTPILDRRAAWQVADILAGTPRPVGASGEHIAFKTGTSYGYRDAWAIGFDGRHVIGVWVGRPDGAPVPGQTGYETAAPLLFEAFARLGQDRAPLPKPPAGTLIAPTADLPAPLRRVHHPEFGILQRATGPEIAYPPHRARIDAGGADSGGGPLVLKVRNGAPPFIWFVNGAPVARAPFGRPQRWHPDGPGFAAISVVDANGKADRVSVYVE